MLHKCPSCCNAPGRLRGQTFSTYKRCERQPRAVASGCHDAARGSAYAGTGVRSRGWKLKYHE